MPPSIRTAIAKAMSHSKQTIPHYYLTARADMTAALAQREQINAGRAPEARVSVNDLIIRATALALGQHPQFNAYYIDGEPQLQDAIHIGIAIALEEGLIAPAILDCAALSLDDIAQRSRDLAQRARTGQVKASEYTSATFTVSNLGMYGIDSFTAIIVPPQVAILAVGAVEDAPVWNDSGWVRSRRLTLTLSADHRATDGAQGAQFLMELVARLEAPERLF